MLGDLPDNYIQNSLLAILLTALVRHSEVTPTLGNLRLLRLVCPFARESQVSMASKQACLWSFSATNADAVHRKTCADACAIL
jgi:hypothetical protein